MPWRYVQKTGQLWHDGQLIAVGYAGRGRGKNNPEMQFVSRTGPLPCGSYQFKGPPHEGGHLGPDVMYLAPAPDNEMGGRGAFFIHADSVSHPGEASEGCICVSREARWAIWNSGDHYLNVVADQPQHQENQA